MKALRFMFAPALFWLCAAVILVPMAARLPSRLEVEAHVQGAEYLEAADMLEREFQSPLANALVLVAGGLPRDASSLNDLLDRIVSRLESDPAVDRVLSYRNTKDPLYLGSEGTGALIVVGMKPNAAPRSNEQTLDRLRARTDDLQAELAKQVPEIRLRWTGEAALNADLRRVSGEEAAAGEARVLPFAALIVLIAFGSVVAAGLPVGIGLASVGLALGVASLVTQWFPLSVVVVNVATMLGLGLGIDYALLMVNRFREELAAGKDPRLAARATRDTAGRTIALSAATVAIGFCALFLVPIDEIQSIAAGGLIVVLLSFLLATTLLPPVLALLGTKVNALAVRRPWRVSGGVWRRWSRIVFANPARCLVLGSAPLVLLAAQAARLNIDLPRGDWLPESAASVQALDDLETIGRSGFVQAINVVVTLPEGVSLTDEDGWTRVAETTRHLARDSRVLAVRSLTALDLGERPWTHLSQLPPSVTGGFVNADRMKALVIVIPKGDVDSFELSRLVRDIRTGDATGDAPERGSVTVGGIPAINADYEDAVRKSFAPVALLVGGVTFLILAWGYRSPLLALKATVLNALSVAAACGALVLVFQDGIGAGLLGLDGPTGGVFPNIPILVFCIVFGLSMDYEVFLFNRVREAHDEGHGDGEAMAIGLGSTAGLISYAALIMIVVFAGFCWGDFLLIKMLGFTLAAAILIDVTLVRLVLGPSLFALAGRWNWWPGTAGVDRRLRARQRRASP